MSRHNVVGCRLSLLTELARRPQVSECLNKYITPGGECAVGNFLVAGAHTAT